MSNLQVCRNSLLKYHLTVLRDKNTCYNIYQDHLTIAAKIVLTEALSSLPLQEVQINTPLTATTGWKPAEDLVGTIVLRASLGMFMALKALYNFTRFAFIGMARDETTLMAHSSYQNIPQLKNDSRVILMDPMLATGGSFLKAIAIIKKINPHCNLQIVSLLAAPEGIKKIHAVYPNILITTGSVDEKLNEQGYIYPGLGDAGDRLFGTEK